jgi:hypothetical protein
LAAAAAPAAEGTHLAPASITRVGDGGAIYTYQVGSHRLTFPVLPAGFNLSTASPAQLAQHGLPAAPADPRAKQAWTQMFTTLGRVRPPDLVVRDAPPDSVRQAKTPTDPLPTSPSHFNTSDSSYNWAGKVAYESGQPAYYTGVQGSWTQPAINPTPCPGGTHLTWVGIGGYSGGGGLLQDGTDQNNQPWFEYLGPNNTGVAEQIFPNNIAINPGDTILAGTAYTSGYSGEGQAWWFVEDQTTGQSTLAGLDYASPFYDGSSEEFIDERSCSGASAGSCVLTAVADYGRTEWTGAEAATSSTYKNPVASLPNVIQEYMVSNSSNLILAAPLDHYTPGAWKTSWFNCS